MNTEQAVAVDGEAPDNLKITPGMAPSISPIVSNGFHP